ncbi:unnamed protein product [Scytosiphon promiscuus]
MVRQEQGTVRGCSHPTRSAEPHRKRVQGFTSAAGQRPEPHTPHPFSSPSSNALTLGKDAIADVIAEAAAGRFGGAASTFPSLGRLTEVEEEEIVLVNSFLNSQPQIDALPPGRADYEDHISKELHWIDRPRIDKLTAAGRLGRTNDRRQQHMVPVSPRTGRAVPERPGNSSYNALSRDKKSSTKTTTLVGILKQAGKKTDRNVGGDRAQANPRPESPTLGLATRQSGATLGGTNAVTAASGPGGKGDTRLLPSSLPSSLRHRAGEAQDEDEVLVEDASEPRSDRWISGDCEHGMASRGETSSAGPAQEGGHSPGNRTDDSSSAEGEPAMPRNSTVGVLPVTRDQTQHGSARSPAAGTKKEHGMTLREASLIPAGMTRDGEQASPFESGARQARDPAPPGRQGERQAWDGGSSSSSAGAFSAVKKRGDIYGRGRIEDPKGVQVVGANRLEVEKQREEARVGPSRTTSHNPPHTGERNINTMSRADVKGKEDATAAEGIEPEKATVVASPKQLRKGGSEGSLHNSLAFLSTKATSPSESKTRLPQAPAKRGTNHSKPSDDYPGPGWGPEDIRRDDVGLSAQPRAVTELVNPPRFQAQGKGQEAWGRRASGDGGGSLQQLAQTPNPQQRRLPSPRPQQGLGQGDRRQASPAEKGPLFPQARPSSAPPQRSDTVDSDSNSCSTNTPDDDRSNRSGAGGNGGISRSIPGSESGASVVPASSSVGTPNQGYPVHGLMPSGSTVQMNTSTSDRSGRWGAAVSGANESGSISTRPRSSSQPQGALAGGSSGGEREVATILRSLVSFGSARLSLLEHLIASQHRSDPPESGSSAASLPREVRTPTSAAAYSVSHSSRTRATGVPAPPPTTDRSNGAASSGGDHLRRHGNRRGFDSTSKVANASRVKATGILRPTAGTLPLTSRIRSSYSRGGDAGDGDGRGSSGDAVRWANPASGGRHGHANVSSGMYGSPGSKENRGGGSGGISSRASKAFGDAYGQVALDGRNQQNPAGRAGGAPIYRAGSPAPTRGRRSAANAAAASTTTPDSSRLLQQQRSRGTDKKRHPSGMPPGTRGYVASSGSSGAGGNVADGGRRGTTARRGHAPSSTGRDRGSRASASDAVRRQEAAQKLAQASLAAAPYAFPIPDRSSGQRPSTSEGLSGVGGAGRRGRSVSPALRPSSASGRRRSASPSPASLFTSKIDPSFDRPRWK